MTRQILAGLGAVLCGGLVACSAPTAPAPRDAVPMAITDDMRTWWTANEACSGLAGRIDAVTFLQVPGAWEVTYDGADRVGYWTSDGPTIVIAGAYATSEHAMRHEMMHALLHGGSDHPAQYFNGACGDLR